VSIVVKLGGSLYNTHELQVWLSTLAKHAQHHPIIIVPGGGPFADQVRNAQSTHHFNDQAAHHMALLAMKQFGLLLKALAPSCSTFVLGHKNHSPLSIWLPDDALLNEVELDQSWDISSDSLALWLANKVSAQQLILIKRANTLSTSIKQLTSDTVIDSAFSSLFSRHSVATKIIHSKQSQQFFELASSDNNQLKLSS